MKLTSVTGYQGQQIWAIFRHGIFTNDAMLSVRKFKQQYINELDSTYYDLRNTANAKVIEVVEQLSALGIDKLQEMRSLVQSQPIPVRAFLVDRFSYVDEYLNKFGQKFLPEVHSEDQLLRYGLVDLWNNRIREKHWK
jgi:hypothetical protein